MRHVWAVLILGLLPLTVFGQQPATTAPPATSDSDLAQHIRDLEDRVIALEGQVRMLKAAAAQPAPAQPGAAQPAESAAQAALRQLPADILERLDRLSPVGYLPDVHAPVIAILHDEGDQVIPISESRQIQAGLAHLSGLRYTVMHFSHLDPTKGQLPLPELLRQFINFFRGILPLFVRST